MQWLREVWNRLTLNQRMLIGIVGGALTVALMASVFWARQPDYTVLYGNVNPEDAAQIVDQLRAKKIPFRLEDAGRTVMVPSKFVYEQRLELAVQGLPESGMVGYEIFDDAGFGVTDFVQRLNYRRSLEGEIARTIQGLNEVVAARVHIVLPEETLFVEDQKLATASVVLRLKGSLGESQTSGIVRLVAASVEGLTPENVTLVDTYGNLLSRRQSDDTMASLASTQLELKSEVEGYLRDKIFSMLENVLGRGKVVAEINADLDFEQIERTNETFDSEAPAVRSEQRIKGTEGDEGGKNESIVTNYELSKTLERIISPVGGVRKLTVAVLLDGNWVTNEDGERAYVPRDQEEINQLREIIQTAVGFDADRGDRIEVHSVPFDNDELLAEQTAIEKSNRMSLLIPVLNRVGQVLVILLLAVLVRSFYRRTSGAIQSHMESVRNTQDRDSSIMAVPTEDEKYLRMQQQIVALIEQRPEEISRVLRAWLKED